MLFIYFLILSGFIFSKGFFSFQSIAVLLVVLFLYPFIVFRQKKKIKEILTPQSLLIILSVLSVGLYGGLYQTNVALYILSIFALGLSVILVLFLISEKKENKVFRVYLLIFTFAILVRILMIWSSPIPYIDVFDYLKYGALGFLHGINPYSNTYTRLYQDLVPDSYPYLPGMLYLSLPFVSIFNDPRHLFALSEIGTALLVYKLIGKRQIRYIYSLLFLFNPISLYMIEESYTEPLLVFLLVVIGWMIKDKKFIFASLVFGVTLATKQYIILLIPIFFRLFSGIKSKIIMFCISIIAAGLIILPFYFWNPVDFLHDAVFLQHEFNPRYEGLTVSSLFYRSVGIPYNFKVSIAVIGVFLIAIYSLLKVNLARFFYMSSFIFLIFFIFNKWAFMNYYYLIAQLFLLGIIFEIKRN